MLVAVVVKVFGNGGSCNRWANILRLTDTSAPRYHVFHAIRINKCNFFSSI